MAARSSWKGFLRLSLVSIPVKAFTATATGGGTIHLNQLHAGCNNRVKYQKVCPIHGELAADQIVSGYEFAKGQYIVIDPDEIEKLRSDSDKAVMIDAFVPEKEIDPILYSGRTYYLLPDGPIGEKPYALLVKGMHEAKRNAVAQVVMHGKDQVVLLRPIDNLLTMSILSFESQVNKPDEFSGDAPKEEVSAPELELVKQLIAATTPSKFDYSKYKDTYTDKLAELIEAKVQGKDLVSPPVHEEKHVINLMEALKQSVAAMQQDAPAAAPAAAEEEKPAKKMAKSAPKKPAAEKKRKTS